VLFRYEYYIFEDVKKLNMDTTTAQKVNTWLNGNFDEATKAGIKRMQQENAEELTESFYKNLEFGTGGLRGIMGVGTNRMNKYTVGMATQGYANYLKQCFGNDISVAIAHDSRNNSRSGNNCECFCSERNKSLFV